MEARDKNTNIHHAVLIARSDEREAQEESEHVANATAS